MSLHHGCWYQFSGFDENNFVIIIISFLVFEFYLVFLGAKAFKDDLLSEATWNWQNHCGIPCPGDIDVFQKQHITYSHTKFRLRGNAGHHKEFFQRTSAFCQVKRNSEKTNCGWSGNGFFSVELQNTALCSSGEFQNCMNSICMCYQGLP